MSAGLARSWWAIGLRGIATLLFGLAVVMLPSPTIASLVLLFAVYITADGWNFQRESAEKAVSRLRGVKGISNSIRVKPRIAPSEIRRKIEEAFRRSAEIDADNITVETHGAEVILKGRLRSWAERDEAERAAWAAPGVSRVDNRVTVSHPVVAAARGARG